MIFGQSLVQFTVILHVFPLLAYLNIDHLLKALCFTLLAGGMVHSPVMHSPVIMKKTENTGFTPVTSGIIVNPQTAAPPHVPTPPRPIPPRATRHRQCPRGLPPRRAATLLVCNPRWFIVTFYIQLLTFVTNYLC